MNYWKRTRIFTATIPTVNQLLKGIQMTEFQNNACGIDFEEAQENPGSAYFLFTIQDGASSGGGASCYFWYDSPEQLLNSIKSHMDFWNWGNGIENASLAIAKIIDKYDNPYALDNMLLSELSDYSHRNAGVHLWAWGTFEDLCSDYDPFCVETRTEFRDWCESTGQVSYTSESGEEVSGVNPSEPIDEIELDLFKEYLSQTPT